MNLETVLYLSFSRVFLGGWHLLAFCKSYIKGYVKVNFKERNNNNNNNNNNSNNSNNNNNKVACSGTGGVFQWPLAKFLRTPFLIEHLCWLLLKNIFSRILKIFTGH